ncbi:MAG TPA: threonine ammonia-lyase [Cellulomonas sp.]
MIGTADVKAAAALLGGIVTRTPVQRSRVLSELVGTDVWLKCENLQRAGSFKIRGAYTRIARLSDEEKARGVVAASAGNHAQGVALAAQQLGIDSVVFMPEDAALPKISATKAYGARVVLTGSSVDEALVAAHAHAQATGAVLVHPFDHVDIVAGQGTVGLEIADQVPGVATVLVPVGGGGLVAGIVAALDDRPGVQVVGVQASHAAAYPESLLAGHPVKAPELRTMADGIAVGLPGEVPFEIVASHHVPVRTVSEEDLSRAMLLVAERAKLVVEASGAAGVAALMAAPQDFAARGPVVAVLSGGNVDPLVLMRLIRHGLASAGRFLQLRITIADTPGALAGVLRDIARLGANVIDVVHLRTGRELAFDEVSIEVEVETKGPEHCSDVVRRLRESGYRLAD